MWLHFKSDNSRNNGSVCALNLLLLYFISLSFAIRALFCMAALNCHRIILLIRNYELLIRNYELLIRNYGLLIRNYELLIRIYELVIRNY